MSWNCRVKLAFMFDHRSFKGDGEVMFGDVLKGGSIVTGLAIGVGFALLAPVVKPFVRPLAKSAIKAGLAAYDQGRVALAELSEQAGDMVAEVRSEMEKEVASGEDRERRGAQRSEPAEARHTR